MRPSRQCIRIAICFCSNKKFDSWLKLVGFTVAKAVVYSTQGGQSHHFIDTYQLIASNNRAALDDYKRPTQHQICGPANHFLGF
jgi:hypothetical protein